MPIVTPRHPRHETVSGVCCAAPLLLALLATAFVVQTLLVNGFASSPQASFEAEPFRILMAAQLPLIALFAFTVDWRREARSARLLLLQVAGWFAPLAAIGAWQLAAG